MRGLKRGVVEVAPLEFTAWVFGSDVRSNNLASRQIRAGQFSTKHKSWAVAACANTGDGADYGLLSRKWSGHFENKLCSFGNLQHHNQKLPRSILRRQLPRESTPAQSGQAIPPQIKVPTASAKAFIPTSPWKFLRSSRPSVLGWWLGQGMLSIPQKFVWRMKNFVLKSVRNVRLGPSTWLDHDFTRVLYVPKFAY